MSDINVTLSEQEQVRRAKLQSRKKMIRLRRRRNPTL